MKHLLLVIFALCLTSFAVDGQDRHSSKTGQVWFLAPTSVEDVEARSNEVSTVFDSGTGEITVIVPVRSFGFPTPLMKRHFNQSYMESARFPEATFHGKLLNFRSIPFQKPGTVPGKIRGKLTVHGVTKALEADCTLTSKGGELVATSQFSLLAEDFGIEMPIILGNDPIVVHVEITLGTDRAPGPK